ncbi:MAG: hypothetical protein KGJ23_04050 [Euryarchaeota archaeon]|nr:hypothetical protein [Euryarchaeota archaeon]MDE1835771.1 hypothetical protein [Euryarchaeota archaeon]MDE1881546.1 hypothetical protein [Euryarchaeota archaeon]MDE2043962.1 hypothetical protein [Thermoplasmata archaeon]
MVYLKDEGSEFEAPVDFVWKYIFGGEGHDAAHKTTRNPKFKKVSEITIEYGSERLLRGKWAPDRMRITMVPPISVTTEWLDGVLAGSKFVYVYKPQGEKTRIDVYGEFTSPTLPPEGVEAAAREFLESEFRDDAPAVKAEYHRAKSARP